MRNLQTYSVISVVFAICFAITAPLIIVCDSHDNYILEMSEFDEESQTEQEENQEELNDNDLKDDFIYSAFIADLELKSQFIRFNRLLDIVFSDPSSPPPENC